jgi:rSAM/selenodomain-associated transferase 1
MRPQRHLVIFAKAPRLGQVKTRLAASIGALAALRFHRCNTELLLRRLSRDRRWRCWLALTPDRCVVDPRVWGAPCQRIAQGRGDLGARMARPFRILPPGRILVIGSDIPDITPTHIVAAFRLLGRHRLVLGPAPDGGYWLLGAWSRALPDRLFAGVRWSTEHALADTLANLPRRMTAGFAPILADVDDAGAYARWRRRLRASANAPAGAA